MRFKKNQIWGIKRTVRNYLSVLYGIICGLLDASLVLMVIRLHERTIRYIFAG